MSWASKQKNSHIHKFIRYGITFKCVTWSCTMGDVSFGTMAIPAKPEDLINHALEAHNCPLGQNFIEIDRSGQKSWVPFRKGE